MLATITASNRFGLATRLLGSATTASKLPASGTDYRYGEHAPSLEEIEQLARRRQQINGVRFD